MNMVDTIGLSAAIITTVYTSFGLPVQVYKNFQNKSVEAFSLVMTLMMLLTFTSWVVYGFVKPTPDWYVIVSNTPGALCAAIILVQFALYRKPPAAAGQSLP